MGDKMPGNREGEKPNPPSEAPVQHNRNVVEKPMPGVTTNKHGGFQMTPTTFILGEELIAIVRMLSAINQNLAFMARTIHNHYNPNDVGKDISGK